MDVIEQFKQKLTDNAQDVVPFFCSLSEREQTSLKTTMVELIDSGIPYWSETADKLRVCAMKALPQKHYKKHFQHVPELYFTKRYYKNFQPQWLSSYLDKEWERISYLNILELLDLGYDFTEEAIASRLLDSHYDYSLEKGGYIEDLSLFEQYPISLDEHFWLVFTLPTEIHLSHDYGGKRGWATLITDLTADKKIDRQRVLHECLLTSTRNFNKLAVGWFFTLFESLNPTPEEIQSLLPELMLVLNCPHSKPVNTALKHFKTLCTQADFPVDDFLTTSTILLTSEVKAIITNTFAVLDKLTKNHTDRHAEISETAVHALIHSDEKVQMRVAKFLLKYAHADDENLRLHVATYYPDLFTAVKTLLAPFIDDENNDCAPAEDTYSATAVEYVRDDNRIDYPQTFDDQLFFVTQAFENNEPWHFDVYLQTIVSLIPRINGENIERLAPVVKSSLRLLKAEGKRTGYIEYFMAIQFLNIIASLLEKYPNQTLQKTYDAINRIDRVSWRGTGKATDELESLNIRFPSLELFKNRLIFAKNIALSGQHYAFLSTPTHSPCYLDINTFCRRLETADTVDSTDFQLALSRLILDTADVKHSLTGEFADIVDYLTGKTPLDVKRCQRPELWAIAILRSQNEQALHDFIAYFDLSLKHLSAPIIWHIDYEEEYDWKWLRINHLPIIKLDDKPITFLDYFWQDFDQRPHVTTYSLSYFEAQEHDKLIGLAPFSPALIQNEINRLVTGGKFTDNEITESTLRTLSILRETWQANFPEASYLHLACTLLNDNKANRQLAGELWLQKVSENQMDSEQLGRVLGKLEHEEFAPLKRFTDLITAQLMNVSTQHNQALITVITAMITAMHDTPIKGVKKLLELYLELLTVSKMPLPSVVETKLTTWAEVKSLKSIVRKLLA